MFVIVQGNFSTVLLQIMSNISILGMIFLNHERMLYVQSFKGRQNGSKAIQYINSFAWIAHQTTNLDTF